MGTVLRAATREGFDVKARVFDVDQSGDWEPSQPLSAREVPNSITHVFIGQSTKDRAAEQNKRLEAAFAGFDEYLRKTGNPAPGCTRLFNVAEQAAREPFPITVFLLGGTICSTPKVTLRLPDNRTVILLLAPNDGRDAGDDCELLRRMRLIGSSFPSALLLTAGSTESFADAFSKRTAELSPPGVTIRGCDGQPRRRVKVSDSEAKLTSNTQNHLYADASFALRILVPKHMVHVGPRVLFQGEGATPGEMLYPFIRVGNEYWPQELVRAHDDGSFDGAVVVGRPFRDCNVTFEFRVFGGVRQEVSVGLSLGAWPIAETSSLPLDLVRTEQCAPGER